MIEIKQSELDKMCDDFDKMNFKAETWWPTVDEIKNYIEPCLKSKLAFAIWITETANEPQTDEEKAAKRYLLNLIYKNVKVIDDDEEDIVSE